MDGSLKMINIGIIGMGRMGIIHHEFINETNGLNVIAVCDKSKKRELEVKSKHELDLYLDIDEFLSIPEIDYDVVCTTNESHEGLAIKALNKGKNVIVEKPMSTSYESALKMVKAAEKNNKSLFVHHSTLWDRDYTTIKDTIKSGILGKILVIQSRAMFWGEFWAGWGIDGMENPWRIKKEYGGGLLMDWGPHLIGQLLQIMKKEPVGVFGILQSGLWATEVPDHFSANIKFDDNIICQIEASNNCRIASPRWYVIGTKGTLTVPSFLSNVWDKIEINYEKDNGKKEIINITLVGHPGGGLEPGFYNALLQYEHGDKDAMVSMYESLSGMKIIDMIIKSSKENKYVEY